VVVPSQGVHPCVGFDVARGVPLALGAPWGVHHSVLLAGEKWWISFLGNDASLWAGRRAESGPDAKSIVGVSRVVCADPRRGDCPSA
jgi:hypothetical protein